MKKIKAWLPLAIAVSALIFVSCVLGSFANPNTATKLLITNGFTNVKLTNTDHVFAGLKGCGREDLTVFTFSAVNPVGKTVNVKVCQGWPIKGATIRSL